MLKIPFDQSTRTTEAKLLKFKTSWHRYRAFQLLQLSEMAYQILGGKTVKNVQMDPQTNGDMVDKALARNRRKSVPCTVRTSRQKLCNQRVSCLQ